MMVRLLATRNQPLYHSPIEFLSSAKGAAFISKPGAAPQDYGKSEYPSAESAIHFAQQFESTRQLNRAFSARFRGDLNSWGDAPG
jgi:hypothetical protein